MVEKVKTAVLISGHGSNLQALLDAAAAPDYPAEITLVISNKEDAYGLVRAENAGVPTAIVSHLNYPDRESFDRMLDAALKSHGVELVAMAGFMRILSDWFVEQWHGRLLNIHPSLLPAYKGLDTHRRVLEAGERAHGATVHWVSSELDAGEIILQESLTVMPDDTPETLKARVHALEHQLYPAALRGVAQALRHNLPRFEAGTRQLLGHWAYNLLRWWEGRPEAESVRQSHEAIIAEKKVK